MKKILQKAVLCAVVLAAFFLCACSAPVKGLKDDQLLKAGGQYATKEQAAILFCGMQSQYEHMFGTDVWQKKFGEDTLDQYVKTQVKTQLYQITVLNDWAEEKKITLSKKEKKQASKAAQAFAKAFSKEQMKKAGFDKEDVEELYVRYARARKAYREAVKNVDTEISDNEARMIDVQVIFFAFSREENGERMDLTIEERNGLFLTAQEAQQKAAEGTQSFESLAAQYNQGSQLEYHIGRGEMGEAFDAAAFDLASGQVSGLVEGQDGYYIIKCISNYNQAETDANKTAIYEEECRKVFNEKLEKYTKDMQVKVNEDAWAGVSKAEGQMPDVDFVKIFEDAE